ncbi:minor capsid protein [Castor fiber polyomavirus 1]
MGGVLTILVDIIELASELSAATGFSIDAIVTGEAIASIEAQISSIVTLEGMEGLDALVSLGVTTEQFSYLSAIPGMVSDAVGIGVIFQTVSGASSLIAAGIHFGYSKEVSIVNRNMTALIPWRPEDYYDILFPGVQSFSYTLDVLASWSSSLFHTVGRYIWDSLLTEGRRQIGQRGQELIVRGTHSLTESLAKILENARWVLQSGPSNIYSYLDNYYRELPGLNPAQVRAQYRKIKETMPDRHNLAASDTESGETIEFYKSPGGAQQRVTPDWMLPLILGLYGDITPTWNKYIKEIEASEDGPKKKRRRV